MARRYWNDEDDALLLQLRMDGFAYEVIAPELGRTPHACEMRRDLIFRRAREVAEGDARKTGPRSFTAEECADLLRMRDVEGMIFADIDIALGRKAGVSNWKYNQLQRASGKRGAVVSRGAVASNATPKQIADRDTRASLVHASLTAEFCGDPLPGRSALDLKRQSTAHLTHTGETHASHY